MQTRTLRMLTVVVGALLVGAPAHAAPVIVPSAQAAAEGNFDNGFPFNISAFALNSQRYQQVYAANEFPAGAQLITHIRFRPDVNFGNPFATVLPSVRIDLSTTTAAPDALSNIFAANVGADNQIVYGGAAGAPLALSSADTPGPGGTRAFDIVITLATPFLYDPANGHLLLDVRNFGGGNSTQFDAAFVTGDPVSRGFSLSAGVGSATGTIDTGGLVTQFESVPADSDGDGVPDPDDECPNSDLRPKVDTGSGPTSVNNIVDANGCSIQDLVNHCQENPKNHGAYVSCIADLANRLKAAGIITGKQHGELVSGAARSKIGK